MFWCFSSHWSYVSSIISHSIRTKENRIYIRGAFTRKKCKTAILFYCFHTAGVLHINLNYFIFALRNFLLALACFLDLAYFFFALICFLFAHKGFYFVLICSIFTLVWFFFGLNCFLFALVYFLFAVPSFLFALVFFYLF